MVKILKDPRFIEQLRHLVVVVCNLQSDDVRLRWCSGGAWATKSQDPPGGLGSRRQQLDVLGEIADGAAGCAQSVEEAALVLSGWARNNPGNLGGE